ncbi:MAG: hypothetical protein ONB25_03470 [candidate division KSB1 bacterium]|nr:hypothetical protein [candidate division KSB1 bacterium]MDZ7412022.1 hypothetical protein [candidate division KSB1 bacterium]
MPIIVVRKGQAARKVVSTPVVKEEYLQEYIRKNPAVIPLDDIRENMQLLVFAREFPTPSGPIDALAVDEEGALYIIETKLYKNPDKRLVVAQVLDYGAALWNSFDDYSEMETRIDQMVRATSGMSFRETVADFFGLDEEQVKMAMSRFESDLNSGRINFIFLMDRIHDELKGLVDFINANSRFRLLACEVEFYRYEDLDILVPKLYGAATIRQSSASASRRRWDEASFFEEVKRRCDEAGQESIRRLFEFARQTEAMIAWGSGAARGSFNPKYERVSARSIFTVCSDGELRVNFGWLDDNRQTLEFRKRLKQLLAERAGLTFPPGWERTFVRFPIEQWKDRVADIVAVLGEMLGSAAQKTRPEEAESAR